MEAARVATQTPVVYEKESEEQDATVDEPGPTDSQPAGAVTGTNDNEDSKPESEEEKSELDDITRMLITNEIRQ